MEPPESGSKRKRDGRGGTRKERSERGKESNDAKDKNAKKSVACCGSKKRLATEQEGGERQEQNQEDCLAVGCPSEACQEAEHYSPATKRQKVGKEQNEGSDFKFELPSISTYPDKDRLDRQQLQQRLPSGAATPPTLMSETTCPFDNGPMYDIGQDEENPFSTSWDPYPEESQEFFSHSSQPPFLGRNAFMSPTTTFFGGSTCDFSDAYTASGSIPDSSSSGCSSSPFSCSSSQVQEKKPAKPARVPQDKETELEDVVACLKELVTLRRKIRDGTASENEFMLVEGLSSLAKDKMRSIMPEMNLDSFVSWQEAKQDAKEQLSEADKEVAMTVYHSCGIPMARFSCEKGLTQSNQAFEELLEIDQDARSTLLSLKDIVHPCSLESFLRGYQRMSCSAIGLPKHITGQCDFFSLKSKKRIPCYFNLTTYVTPEDLFTEMLVLFPISGRTTFCSTR